MTKKNKILSINAGSSSLKVSLFTLDQEPTHLVTCQVNQIGQDGTEFESSNTDVHDEERDVKDVKDHGKALSHILEHMFRIGVAKEEEISHCCHRVVHGGSYKERVVIDNESLHHLEAFTELAPLHNASSISLIRASLERLPNASQIAYLDTTFHQSIPKHIYTFPISPSIAEKYIIRKYGMHGLSYAFILRTAAKYLQKDPSSLNLIVLHLGSGASACCIKEGKSYDTSMSLTPLAGLPGATRSGSIDPSAILYLMRASGDQSIDDAERMLNKSSGWKALTGTSSFGDIVKRAESSDQGEENERARLAFDLFVDRIIDFIGAYYLKLEGKVDALVFAGGIGEKSPQVRRTVVERCECLGFNLDKGANEAKNGEVLRVIGGGDQKQVLVVKTDEQVEMAWECMRDDRL